MNPISAHQSAALNQGRIVILESDFNSKRLGMPYFWAHQGRFSCFIYAMRGDDVLGEINSNGYASLTGRGALGTGKFLSFVGSRKATPARQSGIFLTAGRHYVSVAMALGSAH